MKDIVARLCRYGQHADEDAGGSDVEPDDSVADAPTSTGSPTREVAGVPSEQWEAVPGGDPLQDMVGRLHRDALRVVDAGFRGSNNNASASLGEAKAGAAAPPTEAAVAPHPQGRKRLRAPPENGEGTRRSRSLGQ